MEVTMLLGRLCSVSLTSMRYSGSEGVAPNAALSKRSLKTITAMRWRNDNRQAPRRTGKSMEVTLKETLSLSKPVVGSGTPSFAWGRCFDRIIRIVQAEILLILSILSQLVPVSGFRVVSWPG